MNIEYSIITENDINSILELEKSCFEKSEVFSKEYIEKLVFENIGYKATEQDKVIGYILVCDNTISKPFRLASKTISSLAVSSEYRNLGIGTQLLQIVTSSKNIKWFLHVRKSNYIAQLLYTKIGFLFSQEIKNYYKDPEEDAIYMMFNNLV